jgi:hypothetical protein
VRKHRPAERPLCGELGDLFVSSDGVVGHTMFDGDDDDAYETPFLARAAWEGGAREMTWATWADYRSSEQPSRRVLPPAGAVAYDGIGEATFGCHRSDGLDALTAAVAADLATVDRFRTERPEAAALVADELATFEQYLRAWLYTRQAEEDTNG